MGNDINTPAIEVNYFSFEMKADTDISICITGAPCNIEIDNKKEIQWNVFTLEKGQHLKIENIIRGSRVYICIANGIEVTYIHGSCSYDSTLNIGDKVETNQIIGLKKVNLKREGYKLNKVLIPKYGTSWNINYCSGPDEDTFKKHRVFFEESQFEVSLNSNHVGIRLNNVKLKYFKPKNIVSRGIIPGAIEITPEGQPIILHRGRGGTIGYPVIGCVSTVDLDRIGQVRPGDKVFFKKISIDEAIEKQKMQNKQIKEVLRHSQKLNQEVKDV